MRHSIKIPFSKQTYSEEYVPLSKDSNLLVGRRAMGILTPREASRLEALARGPHGHYTQFSDRLGIKYHAERHGEDIQKQFAWIMHMNSIFRSNAPRVFSMVYKYDIGRPYGYIVEHLNGHTLQDVMWNIKEHARIERLVARAVRVINRYHMSGVPHGDPGTYNIIVGRHNTGLIDPRPWVCSSIRCLMREDAETFSNGVLKETDLSKDELRRIIKMSASHEVAKAFMAHIDKT